ncbi:phage tail tape measure protein [Rhizobium tumorigenes]|uniref:Phage tail tape measure protein n=1 Tax=Rhizobium tumorigenes TaxID=2041385 RepID=A0AAF1K6L0_9HYPH|nr:phage tail tape measure protein [Rhizobium tumorigenes]WFR96869.1 phage tail tape measure protein [Rhizobium tumorigenes]
MSITADATVRLSLVDRLSGPIQRISARISTFGKRISFDRIGKSVNNLGRSFQGLGDGIARTSGRLATLFGVLGAGSAGAVAGAWGLAKSASDAGSEIHDMAAKLGTSTEALSEWHHVADQAGVQIETFDNAIAKMGINAALAGKGNKQLGQAFRSLGVHVKDAHGKMRSTDEILDDTVVALTKIKDPLSRNSAAFKIFGKAGAELGKILADGAPSIKATREEARRLGVVWSQDGANAADRLGDASTALGKRLKAFGTFVGAQLMPVFSEAVEGINAWFDANTGLIRSKILEWSGRLVSVIRDLFDPTSRIREQFDELGARISAVVDKMKPFVDFLGGPLNAALALIGFWVLAPTIAAVLSLAAAFTTLGVSVIGVAASAIGLAFSGFSKLFSGMAGTAAETGAAAGASYGSAFAKSMRGAVRLGLVGLGAYAAYEISKDVPTTKEEWQQRLAENKKSDDERNKAIMDNGGKTVNKALGFEFLRDKDGYETSPAKRLVDTLKGVFGLGTDAKAPPETAATRASKAQTGRSGTPGLIKTPEFFPGKAKDDNVAPTPPAETKQNYMPPLPGTKAAAQADKADRTRDTGEAEPLRAGSDRQRAEVDSVFRTSDAENARKAGFGGSTETMPGKTKDDILQPLVVHEPQQINSPFTANVYVTATTAAGVDGGAIAKAVESRLRAIASEQAADRGSSLNDE